MQREILPTQPLIVDLDVIFPQPVYIDMLTELSGIAAYKSYYKLICFKFIKINILTFINAALLAQVAIMLLNLTNRRLVWVLKANR